MKTLSTVTPDSAGVRRLRLKRDLVATDNCWNAPRSVPLQRGDVLSTGESASNGRGDLFFVVNGDPAKVASLRGQGFTTRYPFDLGTFDPEVFDAV